MAEKVYYDDSVFHLSSESTIDLKAKIREDPFYGIEYFSFYDEENVQAVEEGEKGNPGWSRLEFYPRVGHVRILKAELDYLDRVAVREWTFNCRTQHGRAPSGTPKEEDMKLIREGVSQLKQSGIDTRTPSGYPEIREVVKRAKREKVDRNSLQEGEFYLVETGGYLNDVVVYRHGKSTLENFNGYEDIQRFYLMEDEVFGRQKYLEFYSSLEPHKPLSSDNLAFYITIPKEGKKGGWSDGKKEAQIYHLTREQVEVIANLKPPEQDPYVGTEWTRESVSIHASIQGLQYERWGKDEHPDSPRYADINRENYQRALQIIIDRFGIDRFSEEVERIMKIHLNTLHTQMHLPDSPYKPHSDISPIGSSLMQLAEQVIINSHPLPKDMSESGHWVNAKSLFGDVDFWNFVRTKHPDTFNRLVDFIESLPKDFEQHGMYATAIIDPVALIQQYYPEAYLEIATSRENFGSDTEEAIVIKYAN